MRIIYTHKPNSLISFFIRLFIFSRWSHCAIELSNGTILDTTMRTGVRVTSKEDFLKEYPDQTIIEVFLFYESIAETFALTQVGKPYDWTALVSLVLQRDWQEPDSWFCSELVEATLSNGGAKRFRDEVNRITPQQSWSVL